MPLATDGLHSRLTAVLVDRGACELDDEEEDDDENGEEGDPQQANGVFVTAIKGIVHGQTEVDRIGH